MGAAYVRGSEYFLHGGWTFLASGVGILFLLMFVPGGLGEVLYRGRDYWLRYLAKHHKLVVPSLVADVMVVSEEAPLHIDTALEGLTSDEALSLSVGVLADTRDEGAKGEGGAGPRVRRPRTTTGEST